MKKKSKKIYSIVFEVLFWAFMFTVFPYLWACWTEAEIGSLYITLDFLFFLALVASFDYRKDDNTNGQQPQKPQPQNPQALAEQQRLIQQQSTAAGVVIGTSLFFGSK